MYQQVDRWRDLEDVLPVPADYDHEKNLNWAAGTLAVLRYVSALGLDRYTGWRCPDKPRFIDAGRVYKRGVAVNRVLDLPEMCSFSVRTMHDPDEMAPYFADGRFIVVDENVKPLLAFFINQGSKLAKGSSLTMRGVSEQHKKLDVVQYVLRTWREGGSRRRWTIVGGGITTDLCAFAASCVGARIDLVPTTLLAMVDAAIGGKTGVNSPEGKNQIGSYYLADNVVICPYWLMSLAKDEILAGSWECIKMALISGDLQLVDQWLAKAEEIDKLDHKKWLEVIEAVIKVKLRFLVIDPYESRGRRQLLNLGHTLAHALETVTLANKGEGLRHGEAVGVGLIYALLLSKKLGKLSTADDLLLRLRSHRGLLVKQNLSNKMKVDRIDAPDLWNKLLAAIVHDKKRRGTKIPWVVLRDKQDSDGFYAELVTIDDKQLLLDCWQQLLKFLD